MPFDGDIINLFRARRAAAIGNVFFHQSGEPFHHLGIFRLNILLLRGITGEIVKLDGQQFLARFAVGLG